MLSQFLLEIILAASWESVLDDPHSNMAMFYSSCSDQEWSLFLRDRGLIEWYLIANYRFSMVGRQGVITLFS